uniref:Velvet domain-containing protein n=1 Tax=Panagrellus redivivus TaxID=6233 RepID=A0A7E4ZUG9_PANRE
MPTPTAPPSCLMTPVQIRHRLYPKLFYSPKNKTPTPQKPLSNGVFEYIIDANVICDDDIFQHEEPTVSRYPSPPISTEGRQPHYNSKYTSFNKKLFEHRSTSGFPRQIPSDPKEDKWRKNVKTPTLQKLKKCGYYLLEYRIRRNNGVKISEIEGRVIPTIAGGIAVVFDHLDSTRTESYSFE